MNICRFMKKKLMVVVGAGASVDLGMPSVNDIDKLFSQWAKQEYQLANDGDITLYCYIRDEVNRHYALNPKPKLQKKTNFEEILYVILQLSAALGDNNYTLPTNAFFGLRVLPKIKPSKGKDKVVDGNVLHELYTMLIDKLLKEFRERCKTIENNQNFVHFKKFINDLHHDYDTAFITLNYDNLITQACPDLFTGFDKKSGCFKPSSIYKRSNWGLIYHLHGSVHFDMPIPEDPSEDMHTIKWKADLNSTFSTNSSNRSSESTHEGIKMPTSVIIAGYGKANQIQRLPFRTYYSRIDEIASKADAFLFIGYGFNDYHLNNSLHAIRSGDTNKPVVIIDWAIDKQDPLGFRDDEWTYNLINTIKLNKNDMTTKKYPNSPPNIRDLKRKNEFEISSNPKYPLSIWYGRLIKACKHYEKIKAELQKNRSSTTFHKE